MTNGQARRAHWSLIDAYVSIVKYNADAVKQCLLQCITAFQLVSSTKTKPCQLSLVQLHRSVRAVTLAACGRIRLRGYVTHRR